MSHQEAVQRLNALADNITNAREQVAQSRQQQQDELDQGISRVESAWNDHLAAQAGNDAA